MHILYVDMSGGVNDPKDKHFIMAGVAVRENAIFHVIKELDDKVKNSALNLPPDIELHGVEILRGKKFWRHIEVADRIAFYKDCLSIFHGQSRQNLRCFGIVAEKAALDSFDIPEYCFEQICSRFNRYLQRLFLHSQRQRNKSGAHKGLLIVDESRYAGMFRNLAIRYRVNGTSWGALRNLAEIPLFAPSEATRLLQLADLVSYALWQRFERKDDQYFKTFVSAFDYDAGVTHGLVHQHSKSIECECPACGTRRR